MLSIAGLQQITEKNVFFSFLCPRIFTASYQSTPRSSPIWSEEMSFSFVAPLSTCHLEFVTCAVNTAFLTS